MPDHVVVYLVDGLESLQATFDTSLPQIRLKKTLARPGDIGVAGILGCKLQDKGPNRILVSKSIASALFVAFQYFHAPSVKGWQTKPSWWLCWKVPSERIRVFVSMAITDMS